MTEVQETPDRRVALIAGVSGIAGSSLAELLVAEGWEVHGLARRPEIGAEGVHSVVADLQRPETVAPALEGVHPTHVFFTAWARQATEAENCAVNGGMLQALLDGLQGEPVEHVALMTGLKHYLGPFESYGQGAVPDTPFREEQERIPGDNFYYVQEDVLWAAAERQDFTWSVHRAHTVTGFATGNAMNMALTLAVYAAICRKTGRVFTYPGSELQWNALTDMTDADLLARQMLWASTSKAGADEPFNVVNGDVFRWRRMWPAIGDMLGVEWQGFEGEPRPLEAQMADAAPVWAEIVAEHGLVEPDLARVASWWHTDADLGRELECVTDTSKAHLAGFTDFVRTEDAFARLFKRYREARIIP
jgi:nucleoside-diphosphate-sugar epimerase